jgi:ABC-type transporter Mla subunit MlaD
VATVIDSLIITLGLDPKNFTQGQRQAVAQLAQFQAQATKSAKDIEDTTRRVTQFFSSMHSNAVSLFSVVLGASGLEEMARRIVTSASSIDKLSNRFDVSVPFISKFGNVVKQVGGNVEEAQGFVSQLADALSQANLSLPSDLFIKLQQLGTIAGTSILARKGGRYDVEQTIKNLAEAVTRAGPDVRNLIATQLGISPGIFEAMRKPGFAARLGAAPGFDKKLADAAQKLVEAFNTLQNRLTIIAARMLDDLLPALTQFADLLDKIVNLTGKGLLEKLGLPLPSDEAPSVLFDVPAFLRRHGMEKLGDLLEGKGREKGATFQERFGFGTPAPKSGASLGDVPLAALATGLKDIPGFRVTSTTGGQHAGRAHGEGRAMDFVVDPKYYDSIVSELRKRFEKEGLTVIDASKKPDSRFWTGPHIHLEFATKAAMERFQAAQGGGHHTENSSETHIGEINVHAPTGNASDITKTIDQTIRRNSYSDSADTGFE